jgi:hypothetical protein
MFSLRRPIGRLFSPDSSNVASAEAAILQQKQVAEGQKTLAALIPWLDLLKEKSGGKFDYKVGEFREVTLRSKRSYTRCKIELKGLWQANAHSWIPLPKHASISVMADGDIIAKLESDRRQDYRQFPARKPNFIEHAVRSVFKFAVQQGKIKIGESDTLEDAWQHFKSLKSLKSENSRPASPLVLKPE